ncbi:MAG: signal recognition particle protein, partial [Oscillospiraceae bacterium]
HPDRMASRILGMGDMLSLIEKAEQSLDMKKAEELEKKLRTQQFTFSDFLDQMDQMKNMGPLQNVLGMLPGMNAKALENVDIDEKRLTHIEAIITSMTFRERELRDKLTPKRKERIANGSGTSLKEVNALIKQFEGMQKMMKQFSGGMSKKMQKKMKRGGFGGGMPGGMPGGFPF